MSTRGFRKVATFEETLAEARKDEQYKPGILSVGLQNHASRIINDPQFQGIQGRMQQDQEELTVRHNEEKTFQNNIQNLAVTAQIPRADLDYLINHLQQPPPPPPPPPRPNNDFAADRERLLVEIEQRSMDDAKKLKAEQTALMARMELLASRNATPMQQIINQYHQAAPPSVAQPTVVNNITNNTVTQQAQREGHSVHHIFLRQNPRDEIASSSQSGNQPPPPPGAGAIMAGGATGPYPVPSRAPLPIEPLTGSKGGRGPPPSGAPPIKTKSKGEAKRIEKIRAGKAAPEEEEIEATTGNRPASAPASGAERILVGKRGAEGSSQGRGLTPLQPGPRFAGTGNNLPSSAFIGPMGPGVPWGSIIGGRIGAGHVIVKTTNVQPFSGTAQRLDPELRQIASRRMREIGIAAEEANGGGTVRRLIAGNKRKEQEPSAPRSMLRAPMGVESQKRRRVGARPAGPQVFNIDT